MFLLLSPCIYDHLHMYLLPYPCVYQLYVSTIIFKWLLLSISVCLWLSLCKHYHLYGPTNLSVSTNFSNHFLYLLPSLLVYYNLCGSTNFFVCILPFLCVCYYLYGSTTVYLCDLSITCRWWRWPSTRICSRPCSEASSWTRRRIFQVLLRSAKLSIAISVTRLSVILPLWPKFKMYLAILRVSFVFGKILKMHSHIHYAIG